MAVTNETYAALVDRVSKLEVALGEALSALKNSSPAKSSDWAAQEAIEAKIKELLA